MPHDYRKGLALLILGFASTAGAQTVHRDTKVTGPRGKSVERQIDIKRTPGKIERDVKITRPGGTFERDISINRSGGPAPAGRPGPGGVVERNITIERNNYFVGGGRPGPRGPIGPPIGGPSFGLFLGGYVPPPPPPVVVVPEPVIVAPVPPPTVVVQPPVRYAAPAQPETIVVDTVAAGLERLQSHHDNSRRDAAISLGRLGDARAVPALSERLEKDWDKDVRVAAAWALGEIGDPRGGVALQRASLYDKKQEVRNVADKAITKLNRPRAEPNVQVVPEGGVAPPPGEANFEPPIETSRSLDPPPPPRPAPPADRPR